MVMRRYVSLFFTVVFSCTAYTQVESKNTEPEKKEEPKEESKAEVPAPAKKVLVSGEHESWYWGFSLGTGVVNLGSRLDTAVESFKSGNSGDELGLNVASSLFVYWPVFDKLLLGVNSGGASHAVLGDNSENFTAGISILSPSVMYALSGHPTGTGWNLRAGVGLGVAFESSELFSYTNSKSGAAARVGVGYRIETVPGIRMIFEVTYGRVFVDDDPSYVVGSGGVLF